MHNALSALIQELRDLQENRGYQIKINQANNQSFENSERYMENGDKYVEY